MADSDENLIPERVIQRMLTTGVDAISGDTTILDAILGLNLEDATERAKARAYWADQPPRVVVGYPREGAQFPCYAITLAADTVLQHYIGEGAESWMLGDVVQGNQHRQRVQGTFVIYVYAIHPDICAWYYRVLKRIANVGAKFLIANDLEEPTVSGAELVPDPQYASENLYVRRLTLTVEYWETWTDQDALWTALNGAGYPSGVGSQIDVAHEDVPGGVKPYTE